MDRVSIPALKQMKRDGRKIVGVVAWDYQIAQIAERAGVDLVSVGDSVGANLWGQPTETEVTIEELLIACKAVRRGTKRALVSCDVPQGAVSAGREAAASAAIRLAKEGGADMVKVLGAPDLVREIVRAGVPVFAEFHGENVAPEKLVEEARRLEEAGAAMLDFRHSGPVAGPVVVNAVSVPVIGGLGGGPWLDGRVRLAHTAIGYGVKWIDSKTETYVNTARLSLQAFTALVESVTWAHYVAQGKGLLDHLNLQRAHLMGGSMGCCPVSAFGVAYPETVLSMVLYWPVGGAKYRINGQQRFAQHLSYVQSHGLAEVASLAASSGKSFGEDRQRRAMGLGHSP